MWQQADRLRADGDFTGARDLLEPACDVAAIRLGTDDPDVVETMRRLAEVHRELGELASARRVLEEALDGAQLRLGDAHPLILRISAELGAIADELGNKHEARRNLGRVARHGPDVLGAEHPYVRTARRYLGIDRAVPPVPPPAPDPGWAAPAPVPVRDEPAVYRPPAPPAYSPGQGPWAVPGRMPTSAAGPQPAPEPGAGTMPQPAPEPGVSGPDTIPGSRPEAVDSARAAPTPVPRGRGPVGGALRGDATDGPGPADGPGTPVATGGVDSGAGPAARSGIINPAAADPHPGGGVAGERRGGDSAAGSAGGSAPQPGRDSSQQPGPEPDRQPDPGPDPRPAGGTDGSDLPPWSRPDPGPSPDGGASDAGSVAPATTVNWPVPDARQASGTGVWAGPTPAGGFPSDHRAGPAGRAVGWARVGKKERAEGESPAGGGDGPGVWAGPAVSQPARDQRRMPSQAEGRRGPRRRGGLVVTAVAMLATAGGAVAVTLASRGDPAAGPAPGTTTASASRPASPVPDTTSARAAAPSSPPTRVRLRDDGVSVTLTWSDPTDGRVPFMIAGGRAGQQSRAFQSLPPGQTAYTVNGLNPSLDYCFTVIAVYTTDVIAPSDLVCTTRGRGPDSSRSGRPSTRSTGH